MRVFYPHWVSGAFLLARRSVLVDVGMLDENFFMYTEEVDLCERIRNRGLRICYDPEWRIVHFGGKSTGMNRLKADTEYRWSQLYFYSKHYSQTRAHILKLYLLLKTGARYLWALITKEDPERIHLRHKVFSTVWEYDLSNHKNPRQAAKKE